MTAAGMTPTETNTSPTDQQHLHEHQNEEYEDKVIQEFSHLLEKSKQLFNGLRYILTICDEFGCMHMYCFAEIFHSMDINNGNRISDERLISIPNYGNFSSNIGMRGRERERN